MEYEEFGRKVKQAFEDSKRRYGAVKLCRVLNRRDTLLPWICAAVKSSAMPMAHL